MRVPFGLRSYATDSESGSWSNGELSDFANDSDADSFCKGFNYDADLPEFETFSPKTDSGKSGTSSNRTNVSQEVKKSWSEIDEQARSQERKLTATKSCEFNTPSPAKGRKHGTASNRVHTAPPSRAERSESWRSRKGLRKDRRGRRNDDQPLKGAVERPYTLPKGPITILRRPESNNEAKVASPDSNSMKFPATPDLKHLGFVEDEQKASSLTNQRKAKVVNTRFGEGFVVENPHNEKVNGGGGGGEFKSVPLVNSKEASKAAIAAMAGLQIHNGQSKSSSTTSRTTSGADSYDRTLGGQFLNSKPRSRTTRSKVKRNRSGLYSDGGGGKSHGGNIPSRTSVGAPNVYIGRRPKLETRHVRAEDFLVGE
eukprot:g1896.t1